MYRKIIRPILFRLNPEQAHRLVVLALRIVGWIPGAGWLLERCCALRDERLEREVFGVKFQNPIGVAAGLDRSAECFRELGAMGFGFVEVGTITPRAQSGNPTPRMFRREEELSVLNRVGLANRGLEVALRHLRRGYKGVVVGCNIACNAATPPEEAPKDFLRCFRNLYQYVDYFTINLSGDDLYDATLTRSSEYILSVLTPLFDFRRGQNQYRPILVKISPDMSDEEIDRITDILIDTPLDGIVAANGTTQHADKIGEGRLSGRPMTERSIALVERIHTRSGGNYPIIGVGGMMTAEDVQRMLNAGADLVQLYTGLIYEGPKLLKDICLSLLPAEEQPEVQVPAPTEAPSSPSEAEEPTTETE